jgi:thioredoxin 1
MEYQFTEGNFEAEVLQSDKPVLVDFFADWCNPCRMMGPVVARIAEEYEGKVKVGKCNIDQNMELARSYNVSSIPAFIIFKDGKPAANYVGAMSAADLKEKVEKTLG